MGWGRGALTNIFISHYIYIYVFVNWTGEGSEKRKKRKKAFTTTPRTGEGVYEYGVCTCLFKLLDLVASIIVCM